MLTHIMLEVRWHTKATVFKSSPIDLDSIDQLLLSGF